MNKWSPLKYPNLESTNKDALALFDVTEFLVRN